MWVRDAAYSIGEGKKGIALFCFSITEVMKKLGFSRNTVKKYLSQMIEDGVIKQIVITDDLTVYRFEKSYLDGATGDRLSAWNN